MSMCMVGGRVHIQNNHLRGGFVRGEEMIDERIAEPKQIPVANDNYTSLLTTIRLPH